MKPHPPTWPLRFLRWFCREDYLEEIEGDLTEIYFLNYHQSPAKAGRQFTWSVIKHFRPEFIKSIQVQSPYKNSAMIKNYFKIAWRNLIKSKLYSVINISGLAAGMAVAMLIGLWVWDELTYDHYHKNHNQLAQVMTTFYRNNVNTGQAVAVPLGNELRTKYGSDFKYVSMASWNFDHALALGDKKISTKGMWVQPVFPSMLTLKMLKGNINGLNDPSSVLLSASVAKSFLVMLIR